jgi:hypothetical protein
MLVTAFFPVGGALEGAIRGTFHVTHNVIASKNRKKTWKKRMAKIARI